jgi:hypothetical protein
MIRPLGRYKLQEVNTMTGEPVDVLLCDFHPVTGWRVRGVSKSDYKTVGIFKFGSIKLLRIPVTRTVRPGHFCNPVKLTIEFVREDQKCVM